MRGFNSVIEVFKSLFEYFVCSLLIMFIFEFSEILIKTFLRTDGLPFHARSGYISNLGGQAPSLYILIHFHNVQVCRILFLAFNNPHPQRFLLYDQITQRGFGLNVWVFPSINAINIYCAKRTLFSDLSNVVIKPKFLL